MRAQKDSHSGNLSGPAQAGVVAALLTLLLLLAVTWVYTAFALHPRQCVFSPDRRYMASTLYGFGEHGIGMETSGFHPFGNGRDYAYNLGELHVMVTRIRWQDNHTLIVGYNDKQHGYLFSPRMWRDVKIVFQLDTQNSIDPFATEADRFD